MLDHELRRQIVSEMHLRRWPVLGAPMTILQVLRLVPPDEREAEFARLLSTPSGAVIDAGASARHLAGRLGPTCQFTWERHSEASTLTLFIDAAGGAQPTDDGPAIADALAFAESLPGSVLRATRVLLVRDEREAETLLPALAFDAGELVSCHIAGRARIWSDFRIAPDGYGRLLVAAGDLPGGDLSRAVQRLQELGNYRNLALVGLPPARAGWPLLDKAEQRLRQLGEAVTHSDVRDDELMQRLSQLSLEIASVASSTSYRMSATRAYAVLVDERLADLAPEPIRGFPSLVDFTQRRFLPAVRTCAAFSERERQVSERAARLTALLRTRIETRIENQNARLLASLERNAAIQLELQHLVEGLSVVAISYYALSLLHHVLEGVSEAGTHLPVAVIIAALTPLVVLGCWLALRRTKHKLLGRSREEEGATDNQITIALRELD